MDNREIMERLRKYVGERNRVLVGWMVLWATAVILFLMTGRALQNATGEDLQWFYYGLGCVLLFMASKRYFKKYAKIFAGDEVKGLDASVVLSETDFSDLMKTHAFDAGTYYGILMRRLLPLMAGSIAVLMVGGALQVTSLKMAGFAAGAMILFPAFACFLEWRRTSWRMTHAAGATRILDGAIDSISLFVGIIAGCIAHVMIAMTPITYLHKVTLMKGFDQQVPVRFSTNAGILTVAFVVAVVLLSLMVTDLSRETLLSIWIKSRKWITIGLFVALFLTFGLLEYKMFNDHVRLTENDFVVKSGGREKAYDLNDVTNLRAYCKDDSLCLEVTFLDGVKVNVLGSVTEETKAWGERYYSDYNYAAELAEKLSERGIIGTLEDAEKLQKIVDGYDRECGEGFARMKELMIH